MSKPTRLFSLLGIVPFLVLASCTGNQPAAGPALADEGIPIASAAAIEGFPTATYREPAAKLHHLQAAWPIAGQQPWSDVVLVPADPVYNPVLKQSEPCGRLLLKGQAGDQVAAIEAGTISYVGFSYMTSWYTSISSQTLQEIRKDVAALPEGDTGAITVNVAITNDQGQRVWYSGLKPDGAGLPKTGARVKQGEVIGSLGRAFKQYAFPTLQIEGESTAVTNRIMALLDAGTPPLIAWKPLNPHEQVDSKLLDQDLQRMWLALQTYHPGLYDTTSQFGLSLAYQNLRLAVSARPRQSINQFGTLVERFIHQVGDSHLSLSMDDYPAAFLPVRLTWLDGRCLVVASTVADIKPGSEVTAIDGTPVAEAAAWLDGLAGHADGRIGSWEAENLQRLFGQLWLVRHEKQAGEKIVLTMADGSRQPLALVPKNPGFASYRWLDRKKLASPVTGLPDSDNLLFRHLDPGLDYLAIGSFAWTDLDRAKLDRYFTGQAASALIPVPALVIDLRDNPGGSGPDSDAFFARFIDKPFPAMLYKQVNARRLPALEGVTNLVDGDELTLAEYGQTPEGYWRSQGPGQTILPRKAGSYAGKVYVLVNGWTGSAASTVAAYFARARRATIIGSPAANGTNRMYADKFAQVQLAHSMLMLRVPLVKMVSEPSGAGGEAATLPVDYLVKTTIASINGTSDPALELARGLATGK